MDVDCIAKQAAAPRVEQVPAMPSQPPEAVCVATKHSLLCALGLGDGHVNALLDSKPACKRLAKFASLAKVAVGKINMRKYHRRFGRHKWHSHAAGSMRNRRTELHLVMLLATRRAILQRIDWAPPDMETLVEWCTSTPTSVPR